IWILFPGCHRFRQFVTISPRGELVTDLRLGAAHGVMTGAGNRVITTYPELLAERPASCNFRIIRHGCPQGHPAEFARSTVPRESMMEDRVRISQVESGDALIFGKHWREYLDGFYVGCSQRSDM